MSAPGIVMKKLLNVGGGNKAIALPSLYAGYEQMLLDIDPAGRPDIVLDARKLATLDAGMFDAVYCSHNLEHYYRHDVQAVLGGFLHVLKPGGFAHVRVPDLEELMRAVVGNGLDVEDVLYQSPAGPITVLDVLYGYGAEIERSGQDFYAHKTGFTKASLTKALDVAGFSPVYVRTGQLEVNALAFKGAPDPDLRALFNLPPQ